MFDLLRTMSLLFSDIKHRRDSMFPQGEDTVQLFVLVLMQLAQRWHRILMSLVPHYFRNAGDLRYFHN